MRKLISYVIPIYNESETISQLFVALNKILAEVEQQYDTEVIIINDGSKDDSLEQLIALHNQDSRWNIVNFSRNFGHQMAITAGIDMANGDAVIIMDADLQDPPQVSLDLIKKWEEGYDVVYAQRRTRQDGAFKKLTANLFYRLIVKISNISIPRNTGDFRLMDKKVVETIRQFRERNRYMRGLVPYVGFRQTGVLFDREARFAGVTKYPLHKMLKLAFDGVTSFSTLPLQWITQVGFFVSFLSFVGILYAIVLRIFFADITVSGWTMMIVSIFFIGGVQMIMLGILGTYIGRIYTETQHRPLYIVEAVYSRTRQPKD